VDTLDFSVLNRSQRIVIQPSAAWPAFRGLSQPVGETADLDIVSFFYNIEKVSLSAQTDVLVVENVVNGLEIDALGSATDVVMVGDNSTTIGTGNVRIDLRDPVNQSLSLLATGATLRLRNFERAEGGAGNDEILGLLNAGNVIVGDDGNDKITGGTLRDVMEGGTGNDVLNGAAGNDSLFGDLGNDILNGGAGDDALLGNAGTDTLNGDAGNDVLSGETGNDLLNGGDGNDQLYGGVGSDVMNGGAGNDRYDYTGLGRDIIRETGGNDTLALGNTLSPSALWLRREDNDLSLLLLGTAERVTIDDWYLGSNQQIETITAGGRSLSTPDVHLLVDAMHDFEIQLLKGKAPSSLYELPLAERQQLDNIIVAAW
jgi:Ca2+-binding RTX toxin-like protein